jgi:RNA polymerase sigma factor (sigma-70 family)
MPQKGPNTPNSAGGQFPLTHWSLVLAAARNPEDTQVQEALARLCELYWGPLYRYVRRSGHARPDAEDLTQAFFERLIAKHALAAATPSPGSFRTFLLSSLKYFVCNEYHKAHAQKRAPASPLLSFDADSAEAGLAREPADAATPEAIYERECAWALVGQVLLRLRARYEAKGKRDLFEALKPSLMGEETAPAYRELAQRFGTTEGALRMEASRMRKALRRLFREELGRLVNHPDEMAEEERHLLKALGC